MIYTFDKKIKQIILVVTIALLLSFSVGYAILNQGLSVIGNVSVLASPEDVFISAISSGTFTNNGSETSNSSKSDTTATLAVKFPRVNSTASYDITIINNGTTSVRYTNVESTITNDAFTYSITGIDTSTIITPGSSITLTVKIFYNDNYKYQLPSDTTSNIVLDFKFVSTKRDTFQSLTGSISPDTGDVTETNNGALFKISINNPNNFPITYYLKGENNFLVYNEKGEIGTYYLEANSSDEFNIYINDSTSSIAEGTSANVNIIANVEDYDDYISCTIDSVTLTLEEKSKYVVLAGGGGIKVTPDDIDYSSSSSSSGIFATTDVDGGYTYYYRGEIDNNYFSFGRYIWRIIRIDSNSNIRLILNGFITDTSGNVVTKSFKSTNTASSKDNADTLLKMVNNINNSSVNSPVYDYIDSTDSTTLRGWYNNNLSSYESYIVNSKFCFDTTGGHATSSGTNTSVFYYGSYQRIGVDAGLYSPDFTCNAEDVFEDKIGLLSSDEYVFAGGAFRTSNTTMFLNDFSSSYAWWTLSPAYYDSYLTTVGLFMVNANGSITDWPDGNTIKNAYAIRPVITVNGNLTITGSGTSTDPYKFSS